MPGFDMTGPTGMGPGTGRSFGQCGSGTGWRRRFDQGRGIGRYFARNRSQAKNGQMSALTDYRRGVEEELDDAEKEEAGLAGK